MSPPASSPAGWRAGTARILSATVSRTAQRWFVSFTVEVRAAVPERHARPGSVIGIDLGVKTLLTGVDERGTSSTRRRARSRSGVAAPPAPGQPRALPQAARLARTAASTRPGSPASTPASRTSARMRCTRQPASLAARYETVVAEDLNVTGMLANRKLARAVADQGFGAARRMLGYKTAWNGGRLLVADRWYPSLQDLLGVRMAKAKPDARRADVHLRGVRPRHGPGRERRAQLACPRIEAGADSGTASGAGTAGSLRLWRPYKTRPGRAVAHLRGLKQEPGTANMGKTGTACGQLAAAGRS